MNDINMLNLGWGITQLDTHFQRPNMAACYIVQDAGEVAIIETGTKDTVPLILACLKQLGLKQSQVKYIIPTHVHLDHAGGVGLLMETLPQATLVVHEKGARHMIDPSKLQAGATAVYGAAEFNKTYGNLLPVDEKRVISPAHKETLKLGERVLTFLDTPGHARHHFCIFDAPSEGFFTGDTFGLAYQELTNENGPFLFPTTTPVQFDPQALKNSISLLLEYGPKQMFLTHYGVLDNPSAHGERLITQVDELVDLAKSAAKEYEPNSEEYIELLNQTLMNHFLENLQKHNCQLSVEEQQAVIKTDVLLNAQGLAVWLS
jgi:glyoxylase-like metal-dependent hydrolase (beta-lactamase superfamily II)